MVYLQLLEGKVRAARERHADSSKLLEQLDDIVDLIDEDRSVMKTTDAAILHGIRSRCQVINKKRGKEADNLELKLSEATAARGEKTSDASV